MSFRREIFLFHWIGKDRQTVSFVCFNYFVLLKALKCYSPLFNHVQSLMIDICFLGQKMQACSPNVEKRRGLAMVKGCLRSINLGRVVCFPDQDGEVSGNKNVVTTCYSKQWQEGGKKDGMFFFFVLRIRLIFNFSKDVSTQRRQSP